MKTYSRIFHHLTTEDVKRKQRENIGLQKIQEKKEIYLQEEKKYIKEVLDGQKSNWRNDLTNA